MRLSVFLLAVIAITSTQLVNKKVKRVVDVSTQIAKVKTDVEVLNSGSGAESKYQVIIDISAIPHLSFINVYQDNNKLALTKLANGEYEATLKTTLPKGGVTNLVILTSFTHLLEPFPLAINQPDNQLVRLHSNAYFYSPYLTTEQTSKFDLRTNKIESFTPRAPSKKESSGIKYGPYKDMPAKSNAKVTIHFENNSPFLTITSLKRVVEISHWGNVAVEEHYEIAHTGAKLKSQFSRLDFQRNPIGAPTAIKSFRTVLPASSKDVYYRDDIGNISTSNLRETEEANELEIRPRFPLFGGWKTKYYIGYSLPSYEMLSYAGNSYKLEFPFLDHSYDNLVVDELEVKVILPEGAHDMEVTYPDYEIERLSDTKHKTYLDTTGRPVLTFTAKNLEDGHIQNMEVYYQFSTLMLLQEPLLVVVAFMVLFMTVIVFVRLDFSITVDENREARQRVAYLVEELFSISNRIKNTVSDEIIEAVSSAKSSKNSKAFKSSKKEAEVLYKQLVDEASAVSKKISSFAPTLSDKVAEVSRRETERKTLINNLLALGDKAVADKINKNACNDQQNTLVGKLATVHASIDDALSAL